MALDSRLVAKVITSNTNGKPTIGTAYPIRQGVIITACHVVPDLGKPEKTCLQWRRDDEKDPSLESSLTKILYYNEDYDILIAECETPENTPVINFQSSYPSTTDDHWESHGYARSGKQEETQTRNKESSSGKFETPQNDHHIQQLILNKGLSNDNLWKGMSGAPVFLADMNIISAIITNTPDQYGKGISIQEKCLYSISIPYLFENLPSKEKEEFFKALGLDACKTTYLEKQKELLKKLLERIQSKHSEFESALKKEFVDGKGNTDLSEGLINTITSNAPDFIQAYWLICEDHVNSKSRDDMKLLLLLLLAQLSSQHPKRAISPLKHLHQLDVSTQILSELIIASHYDASPKLKEENSDIIGEDVLTSSKKEVGWDSKEEAKEQIKSFATQVYKKPYQPDKNPDWISLNRSLASSRLGKKSARIYRYEIEMNAASEADKAHPLLDKAVTDEIERLVSNLIIVQFGNSGNINESEIKAEIRLFFDMLNVAS